MLAGKYRVEAVLGTGGMGVVLSATHVHLREEVAIKLLRADHVVAGRSAERLIREARAASKIRSEHVARVFDVGILDSGSPFIVMERLRGADLASVLEDEPRLPVAVAVDWLLQACEAVVEAHVLGIVHRDLKPANLFRTHRMDGSVCIKVLDFGISKVAGPAARAHMPSAARGSEAPSDVTWDPDAPVDVVRRGSDDERALPGLTGTGAQVGSPRYMAPEQVRSASNVDTRADIWSLGTILYELLVGRAAFDGGSAEELQQAILERSAPRMAASRPDVPRALELAILRCLEKAADSRFPDVAALTSALAPFGSPAAQTSAERIERVMRAAGTAAAVDGPGESTSRDAFAISQASSARSASAPRLRRRASIRLLVIAFAAVSLAALFARLRATTTSYAAQPSAAQLAPTAPADVVTAVALPSAAPSPCAAPSAPPPPPRTPRPALAAPAAPPRAAASASVTAASVPVAAASSAPDRPDRPALHLDPGNLFDGRR